MQKQKKRFMNAKKILTLFSFLPLLLISACGDNADYSANGDSSTLKNSEINKEVKQGKVEGGLLFEEVYVDHGFSHISNLQGAEWIDDFNTFSKTLGYKSGIAIAPLAGDNAKVAGTLQTEIAWSTSKVPVAIAAINHAKSPDPIKQLLKNAITVSDNAAAAGLYHSIGAPRIANPQVEEVLKQGKNNDIHLPASGFFGLTEWPLAQQAIFAANLKCIANAEPVYKLMGEINPSQRWGLGRIPGAHFKGGWGAISKGFLVRQMGVVEVEGKPMGVAIIVIAPSFNQGTKALDRIAEWFIHNAKPFLIDYQC